MEVRKVIASVFVRVSLSHMAELGRSLGALQGQALYEGVRAWADEYLGLTPCCARPGSVAPWTGHSCLPKQKATKGTKNSSSDSHCLSAMIEPAAIFFRLPFVTFVSSCSNLPAAAAEESPRVPVTFPLSRFG